MSETLRNPSSKLEKKYSLVALTALCGFLFIAVLSLDLAANIRTSTIITACVDSNKNEFCDPMDIPIQGLSQLITFPDGHTETRFTNARGLIILPLDQYSLSINVSAPGDKPNSVRNLTGLTFQDTMDKLLQLTLRYSPDLSTPQPQSKLQR